MWPFIVLSSEEILKAILPSPPPTMSCQSKASFCTVHLLPYVATAARISS